MEALDLPEVSAAEIPWTLAGEYVAFVSLLLMDFEYPSNDQAVPRALMPAYLFYRLD